MAHSLLLLALKAQWKSAQGKRQRRPGFRISGISALKVAEATLWHPYPRLFQGAQSTTQGGEDLPWANLLCPCRASDRIERWP